MWRQRSLSYGEKALIINALAESRIWYVASLVHMPPFVLCELKQLVFKFFWVGWWCSLPPVVASQWLMWS